MKWRTQFVLGASCQLVWACGGGASATQDDGGSGMTADSSTTTTSETQSTAETTGTTGPSDTETESGGSTTGPECCVEGEIVCDGNTAKTCDEDCRWVELDCADRACVDGLGCQPCVPGTFMCFENDVLQCNDFGLWGLEESCDALQGITCDAEAGTCVGECLDLSISYIGCDYYPTVTINLAHPANGQFAVAVANASAVDANIAVTKGAENVAMTTVAANSVEEIILPWVPVLKRAGLPAPGNQMMASDLIEEGAYRLRSTHPVTVYQYAPLEFEVDGLYTQANDASLLLPVHAWTGDYFVASRNTWMHGEEIIPPGTSAPGFYAVVASEDDTTVTVTPSATGNSEIAPGGGIQANGAGVAMLDQSDVLQVFSAGQYPNPSPIDLTGTHITANRPIQVISGHKCTDVPFDEPACDHLEESMFPFETLAKDYLVTTPLIKPENGGPFKNARYIRVIATTDDTTLIYDPPNQGPTSLANAGDYFEIGPTETDFRIGSDFKVLVAEYMRGAGATSASPAGDPSMVLSVPTEQFRSEYRFHAPTNYWSSFVNVTAPAGATIVLDGVVVAGFATIGASGFEVARVELSNAGNGDHSIVGDEPFGITVYGYGHSTSYWYAGGLDLELIPQ